MEHLTVEDLLLIAETIGVAAVRDVGLLDAAAHRPRATAFGEDAYPTLHHKAAALLDAVVRNHALVDGNKRLGWSSVVVFYDLNGVDLVPPGVDEAVERLDQGDHIDLGFLARDLGYFDQAHFARDFRSAVGRPPTAYANPPGTRPRW